MTEHDVVSALALGIGLWFVYLVLFDGRKFNARRANTTVRSASGSNLGTIVAVVALASLVIEAGTLPVVNSLPFAAPAIGMGALMLLILTVRSPGWSNLIATGLGVALLASTVGLSGSIILAILTSLLLWLLGAMRGWG